MTDDTHFPDDSFPDESHVPAGSGDLEPDTPVPAVPQADVWPNEEAAAFGAAPDEPHSWAGSDQRLQQAETPGEETEDADAASPEPVAHDPAFDAAPGDEAAADADAGAQDGGEASADPLGDAVGTALAHSDFDGAWNSAGAVTGWSGTAVAPEPPVTAWAVGVEDPDPDYIDPDLLDR